MEKLSSKVLNALIQNQGSLVKSVSSEISMNLIKKITTPDQRKIIKSNFRKVENITDINSVTNICFNDDVIKTLKKCKRNGIKFKMIYGDPDYNVDINYSGEKNAPNKYTKPWDVYMDWYAELTRLCLECLTDDGHLFLLNYPKQNSHLRVKYIESPYPNITEKFNSSKYMEQGDVAEYVWIYNSNIGMNKHKFTTSHRSILHLTKSKQALLNKGNWWFPYKNPKSIIQRKRDKEVLNGNNIEEAEKKAREYVELNGRMSYSWITKAELDSSFLREGGGAMYYDLVKNVSADKTFHPCQIPTKLVDGLIQASTDIDDNVFILFGGSGSELLLANKIGRKFTSCEIYDKYHKMIVERLAVEEDILLKKFKLYDNNTITKSH